MNLFIDSRNQQQVISLSLRRERAAAAAVGVHGWLRLLLPQLGWLITLSNYS